MPHPTKSLAAVLATCSLLLGCDSKTNLIGLTVPADHHDNFYYNLDMARALYDQGNAKEARKYGLRAFEMDPDSEDASILLGFINLSLAGGDPFSLAKALMAAEQAKKGDATPKELAIAQSGSSAETTTSDTLSSIKEAIGISAEELALLATRDDSDGEFPVLIPKCVETARADVERLLLVNEAIRSVCPFVDEGIRNDTDYRQICEPTARIRKKQAKAHFLWAFSHLTEALAFNSVLTFSNPGSTDKKSNLEKRVAKVQAADTSTPDGIAALLESMKGVEATVNAIFPSSGVCSEEAPTSQLRATLNDMLAVDVAFSRIAGIPDNIVASIRKSMAKITNLGGDGGVGSQLAALKGDFTKKMSGGLSAKIDQLSNDPNNPLPESQKKEICSLLGSISSGNATAASCPKD